MNETLLKTLWLGKIAKIPVGINITFLIPLLLIGIFGGIPYLCFFLLMMVSVLFHEFGHAFAASWFYGIKTRFIAMHALGGVAALEEMPDNPVRELVISFAGPLVSLLLAGIGYGMLYYVHDHFIWAWLYIGNLFIGIFNLLPIFPMDGGRINLAVWTMLFNKKKALTIASVLSKLLIIAGGIWALAAGEYQIVIIGAIIWMVGDREIKERRLRDYT